jgi:hypothetical protein
MIAESEASQISDSDWGNIGCQQLLAMTVRYPATHRANIIGTLSSIHEGATTDDWLNRKVSLSNDESTKLGQRLRNNLVLSSVPLTKPNFSALAIPEPKRAQLSGWFAGDSLSTTGSLDMIDSVELRLFTDGQEITIGWEKGLGTEDRKGWVMRAVTLTDDDCKRVAETQKKLQGLIPETRVFRNGPNTLILSEYTNGSYATVDDLVLFRQELARRGIDEAYFDLNQQNVIRTQNGLVYVDKDYLDL